MAYTASTVGTYKRIGVETASQGKLIVMMFNGAMQRAEEARRLLEAGKRDGVHNNLIRAQEILGELRGALNMDMGEIARNLDRIYEYIQHLLIQANIRKDSKPILEAVEHMGAMRDTWIETFEKVAREDAALPTGMPTGRPSDGLINMKG
ncbi:MAG: hypothetical protein AMXMBFR84_45360 [Candidatus Hydrogenedentota bacterium]